MIESPVRSSVSPIPKVAVAESPFRTLSVRVRKRILYLFGWIACPRCAELVRPHYVSEARWRCSECNHLNW